MKRKLVSTSRIISVGWLDGILEIEMKDGSLYRFFDVSYREYRTFINSKSPGYALTFLENDFLYEKI